MPTIEVIQGTCSMAVFFYKGASARANESMLL
mgnify:FL=1